MNKQQVLEQIKSIGIVPVVRTKDKEEARQICEAIIEGGIKCLEITMSTSGATELISELREKFQDSVLIGAGTVLDGETARNCIGAGAKFIVSPCLIPEVIEICSHHEVLICAGALTPTEVFTGWKMGADLIKIFPSSAVGGADYLKSLKAPFPQIEMMPTGSITLETAEDYLKTGACAIGVGSDLADVNAVRKGETEKIKQLARQYLKAVGAARLSKKDEKSL